MDTMQLAGWVGAAIREHQPAELYVDEVGVGAGVVDRLRELGHTVRGVNVANRARQEKVFTNLRAEGYWTLGERFRTGSISIPADNQLVGELAAMRYGYDTQTNRLKIESKDDMRNRGLPSPDKADALMLPSSRQPTGCGSGLKERGRCPMPSKLEGRGSIRRSCEGGGTPSPPTSPKGRGNLSHTIMA